MHTFVFGVASKSSHIKKKKKLFDFLFFHIQDTSSLSDTQYANIFSLSVAYLLIILIMLLQRSVFNFNENLFYGLYFLNTEKSLNIHKHFLRNFLLETLQF